MNRYVIKTCGNEVDEYGEWCDETENFVRIAFKPATKNGAHPATTKEIFSVKEF